MKQENRQPGRRTRCRVSRAFVVVCLLLTPSMGMAAPTIAIFSETQSPGIPVEGIVVKPPEVLQLSGVVDDLAMLMTGITDAPQRTSTFDGEYATTPPGTSPDTESADSPGSPRDFPFIGFMWTESTLSTAWDAVSEQTALKITRTDATADGVEDSARPSGEGLHRYR